jgi:hypothetical protein
MKGRRKGEHKLTAKMQMFADHWLCHFNASRAAAEAGYSKKTAGAIGEELLRKPKVMEYIEKRRLEMSEKLKITQEMVLAEYWKVAKCDIREFFDKDGVPLPVQSLSDRAAGAMAGIEIEVITKKAGYSELPDDDGEIEWMNDQPGEKKSQFKPEREVATTYKFKRFDKIKALDSVCNVLGYNAPKQKEDVPPAKQIKKVEIVRTAASKPQTGEIKAV